MTATPGRLPSILDLTGRRVLVTGAAQGIGQSTAAALGALGAHVVATDLLDLDATRDLVEAEGGTGTWLSGDLADAGFITSLLELGPFDGVAHVAAIFAPDARLSEAERFHATMNINVRATKVLVGGAIDQMIAAGIEGYVVIVGSIAGRSGGTLVTDSADHAAYTASKGAVHALMRWLSRRAIAHGVRVNCVAPGGTAVPATKGLTFDKTVYPLGRLGQPDEIGWPVALLCTPVAGNMSGSTLDANGGAWVG